MRLQNRPTSGALSPWHRAAPLTLLAILLTSCTGDENPGRGSGPSSQTSPTPALPDAEEVNSLVVLVSHNGFPAPISYEEALHSMDEANQYFLRSSCGTLVHQGAEHPEQSTDVVTVDLGDLRRACDVDDDCAEQGVWGAIACEGDPGPDDGVAEGQCACSSGTIWSKAAKLLQDDPSVDMTAYRLFAFIFDPTPFGACTMSACSENFGTYSCNYIEPHEIGHALEFDHAGALYDVTCFERGESDCYSMEYGDLEDIMGFAQTDADLQSMNLPHLMGAGWLAGKVERASSDTYCLHPFDPPADNYGDFCADMKTLRGLEIADSDDFRAVQVGLRAGTGGLNVYESRAGGTTGVTTLVTTLSNEGDAFEAAGSDYLPAFSLRRGAPCEGDGVEVSVGL